MKTANSRRKFLKTEATLSLTPSIPSSIFATSLNKSIIKNGAINTAAHWGMLKANIKNGKIISSQPYEVTSKIPNPLQHYMADLVYKTRIKAPMVRKSYLENPDNPKRQLRGIDEWVEVKYEDAIKLVAKELKKTRAAKGSESIFAGSYGWYSSGKLHNPRILLQRFMNLSGGFTGTLGDYSTGASQIIMPHVVGSIEVYEQQTSWSVILESSKIVVIWGANPISTLKVAWSSADAQGLKYFEELKNSNKEIIVIDPIKSDTAKYLEKAKWIAPIPNTDVAVMLGMAYHLYSTKKYDKDFLENYTIGFDKFLPYLLGKVDNIKKTPKWASKICGLEENLIKELAEKFFDNRTMLISGWGMQRAHHGEQVHWTLVTLASMLGQIGLAGGGFGLSYHCNGGVPTCVGGVLGGINAASIGIIKDDKFMGTLTDMSASNSASQSWLQKTKSFAFPVARVADALLNPGKTIDHNGKKITYPDIDFIYWAGGNPIVHHQNTNNNLKAWRKPRTVVVNEIYWTPTAKMADIVFPVTTEYERNDLTMTGSYSNQNIAPMKQVVSKQFEARDDYQIFSDLCKAYADGLVEAFTENGKNEMDWLKEFYNIARKIVNANTALGMNMLEFEEWWNKNEPISFFPTQESKSWVRFGDFREDPILNSLETPSGRIEIYSETIEKMNYKDCLAYPSWIEPAEWLGMKNKPAKFHMLSPHPADRLHSQQNNTSLKEKYAISDREPILINDNDAKKLGIKNGDLVRVFNKRGEVLAGAIVSNDIRTGVVRLYEGAWFDGFESGICKNGCANTLTIDIPTSSLANGNISDTALVNIEKFKQKAPKLTAFTPPKNAK